MYKDLFVLIPMVFTYIHFFIYNNHIPYIELVLIFRVYHVFNFYHYKFNKVANIFKTVTELFHPKE